SPDYSVSNDFDLENSVHALYANYQRKLTDKLGVQVGLRGEQTYLRSTYHNLDPDVPANQRTDDGTRISSGFIRVHSCLMRLVMRETRCSCLIRVGCNDHVVGR